MLGILPTMVKFYKDDLKILHRQYNREIADNINFKGKLFSSRIRVDNEQINNSTQIPFVLENINKTKSKVAEDFDDFVEEFLERIGDK